MENLELKWLHKEHASLSEYNGMCDSLAEHVSRWLSKTGKKHTTLHIEPVSGSSIMLAKYGTETFEWFYHVVIVSNRLVHDAWFGDPVPLSKYLSSTFGTQFLRLAHYTDRGLFLTETRRNGHLIWSKREG